jgi:hypothetical protein
MSPARALATRTLRVSVAERPGRSDDTLQRAAWRPTPAEVPLGPLALTGRSPRLTFWATVSPRAVPLLVTRQ